MTPGERSLMLPKRCWWQGGELPPDDVAAAIEGLEAAAEAAGVEVKDAAMRWMFSHAPLGAGDAVLMGAPRCRQLSGACRPGFCCRHAPVRLLLLVCLIPAAVGILCCLPAAHSALCAASAALSGRRLEH